MLKHLITFILTSTIILSPLCCYADNKLGQDYINELSNNLNSYTHLLDTRVYQVIYIPHNKTIRYFVGDIKKTKYFTCLTDRHKPLLADSYQFEFVVKKQTQVVNSSVCETFIKEITPQ